MSLDVLLIGPRGNGGEGVYVDAMRNHPPADVSYDVSGDFHTSADGATCMVPAEVALNRFVRRHTFPDIGFRALRLRRRYDIVHSHAHPVLLSGLGSTPLVMSEGSSSAVYVGDYLGWDRSRMAAAFAHSERVYRTLRIHDRLLTTSRAACVYVFSEWAREVNIAWGVDPAKLQVIYPGFDTPPVVDRTGRSTFTFLFVGTDFERKGGYDVLEAFARIADDLPEARLVIAGFDPARPNPDLQLHSWVSPQRRARLMAVFEDLRHAGRASHFPWVPREELSSSLFPAADAFVMPTLAEGFGFTNVEAMSFGLPVITSSAGPAAEIVDDSLTGLLTPPGDVSELAEAMHQLATNPATAAAMGAAGRARFKLRFTRQRFRHNLGTLYQRVVSQA